MKKFKDPLPQGGVPFFADDFLMLQAELLKASMYMYASLNTEVIVSGCVPSLTGIYPSVGIAAISSGYAIIRDRSNANTPEIYLVPATTFDSSVPAAWIIPATDQEDSRILKSGSTAGVIATKVAQIVTTAPDPSYPQIAFNPIPAVTIKNLLFKNAKRIGEVIPIGLIPPFRSNPLIGPNGIPFFQETTIVGGAQAGLGRFDYDGFAICNGLNNTPDLRRRALVGYDSSHSYYSSIGNIGGAEEVRLYKEYMPPHNHDVNAEAGGTGLIRRTVAGEGRTVSAVDAIGSGNEPDIITTPAPIPSDGGGAAHENRSPFYAALYLQRIA